MGPTSRDSDSMPSMGRLSGASHVPAMDVDLAVLVVLAVALALALIWMAYVFPMPVGDDPWLGVEGRLVWLAERGAAHMCGHVPGPPWRGPGNLTCP